MAHHELHLELGYTTWQDFCTHRLQMSPSHLRMLRRIADEFGPALAPAKLLAERIQENGQDTDEQAVAENREVVLALGPSKWDDLRRVMQETDTSLHEVLARGTVTGPDGEVYDLAEIRDMASREVTSRFTAERNRMQERIQALEAEKASLEAENKALQPAKDVELRAIEAAQEAEQLYGLKASLVADKRLRLDSARDHLARFFEGMTQADISTEDPEGLQSDCFLLLSQARDFAERLQNHYYEIVAAQIDATP